MTLLRFITTLAILGLSQAVLTAQQDEPTEVPPELEKQWLDILEKAHPLRRTIVTEDLKAFIEEATKTHALTPAQQDALSTHIPATVDASVKAWAESMNQLHRPRFVDETSVASILKFFGDPPENFVANRYDAPFPFGASTSPTWVEALRQSLPDAAFQIEHQKILQQIAERNKKTEELIAAGIEKFDPIANFTETLRPLRGEILRLTADPETLAPQLDQLIQQAVNAALEDAKAESRKILNALKQDGDTWQASMKSGYYLRYASNFRDSTHNDEAIIQHLPPDVRTAYQKTIQQRRQRLTEAYTALHLLELTQAIPLTDDQRQKIRAIIPACEPEKMERTLALPYDSNLLKSWQNDDLKNLNAILNPAQQNLFAKLAASKSRNRYDSDETDTEADAPWPLDSPPPPEHHIIATYSRIASAHHQQETQEALTTLMRRIDEISLVLDLDEAARDHLILAARGTVHQQSEHSRVGRQHYTLNQLKNIDPKDAANRIQSLGIRNINFAPDPRRPPLLDRVIQKNLSSDQKKRLEAHQQEELKKRHAAILKIILSQADKELKLSTEQYQHLEKMLTKVLEEYGQDIETTFSRWGERKPWFLQSYSIGIPFGGIQTEQIQTIIDEDQLKAWEERIVSRVNHYWEQIQQLHDQRTKNKQPANLKDD